MSREFWCVVSVYGVSRDRIALVEGAVEEEAPRLTFLPQYDDGEASTSIHAEGQVVLCGAEMDRQAGLRIAKAAWKANLAFCEVKVGWACLEDPEGCLYNKDSFERAGGAELWAEEE
jgi:hypothetical protein